MNAHAKHDKTVFFFRMVRVKKFNGVFVIENRLGFEKRHAMFTLILNTLTFIPIKVQTIHTYILLTMYLLVNVWAPSAEVF